MKWDESRYNTKADKPVFFIKNLISLFGCRISLHKMVAADDIMCFHTHPANAIRIILWGGYEEEQFEQLADHRRFTFRLFVPSQIGIVKPDYCHRIHNINNNRSSYSLWIRFRKTHKIKLLGDGWKND